MERREPIIEQEQPEPEPQPKTASAGGVRPPGRIGGGLRDDEGGDEPPRGPPPHWEHPDVYNVPIEDLELSMRAYNCLRRSGLMTLGQVLEKTTEELLGLRNFGPQSYDELRERLDDLGLLEVTAPLPQDP